MPKFSIFSHTRVSYSDHSASLHRHDLRGDEDMRDEAVEQLLLNGHQIVDVWEDGTSRELKESKQSGKMKSGNRSMRQH